MKKMKYGLFMLLFVLSVFSMTACSRNNGSANDKTGTTQSSTQSSSQAGTSQNGTGTTESGEEDESTERGGSGSAGAMESGEEGSTGVIDGLVNDVEDGVDDMIGDTDRGTNGADESR